MNEMLLRGCMLKNSNFIVGLVVYTGKETRIQMNAAKTPLKVGASRFACAVGLCAGAGAAPRPCSWPAHPSPPHPPNQPCAPLAFGCFRCRLL